MTQQRIVVSGAGIVGSVLALRLAERGAAVTLLDAGDPGHGTSRTSFAWVNANAKTPRAYYELNVAGMRAMAWLADELGDGWHFPRGNLEWTEDHDELEQRVTRLREWGYEAEVLTDTEARALEPSLCVPAGPVARFAGEAHVFTGVLLERLLERCRALGVKIRPHHPAPASDAAADTVVWCAGWRTPGVAGVTADPAFIARTEAGPDVLRGVVHAPGINLRPDEGGRLVLEAADVTGDAGELLRRARELVPALDARTVERTDVCVRPMPADGYPIVGWVPRAGRRYVVVTHSGVTLAAHLGRLVAGEILDDDEARVLRPYRPSRFAG